jgi:glycopeptide antibiotics resistance protein
VTLFPLPFQPALLHDLRLSDSPQNNLIPIQGLIQLIGRESSEVAARQIVGNVLLLLPLGYLVPTVWKVRSIRRLMLIALIVSLGIELTQFAVSRAIGYTYKIFDIDDILLNTLGGIIGYGAYLALIPVVRSSGMGDVEDSGLSKGHRASTSPSSSGSTQPNAKIIK